MFGYHGRFLRIDLTCAAAEWAPLPESALRRANEKFTARFEALEDRLHARGRSVHDASLEEMEREWTHVKTATQND